MAARPGRRAAIVAGLRTPFVKSNSAFKDLSALELGRQVVSELVQRSRFFETAEQREREGGEDHQRAEVQGVSCQPRFDE